MGEGMRKPVVFFLPNLNGGGAEKAVVRIIRALLTRGINSELLLLNAEGVYFEELPESYPVYSLDAGNLRFYPNYLLALPRLIAFLRKKEISVVISNLSHLNVMLLFACVFLRKRVRAIVVEHNTFSTVIRNTLKLSPKLLPPLMRWLYPKADFIVGVSQGVIDDLKKVLRFDSEKFRVIYNPIVDEELLKRAEEPLDHPWFQKGEPPVILAAGRLHIQKDFPTLLRAFSLVRKEIPSRLVILGEGEKRQELENLAQELGIREDLDLPGFVENPYKYMKHATVFVLSSQWEGFGNVLVEAMACGCPVVSTDCPSGPREILKDGEYGILVPPKDPEGLARGILQVLENPGFREELSKKGKKRSLDFTVDRAVEEYIKLMEECMKE
jgi:glycosyltransferase involved in cell wall biosynthesis